MDKNVLGFFIVLFISQFIFMVSGFFTADIQNLMRPFRIVLNSLAVYYLLVAYFYKYKNNASEVFLNHLFFVISFHSLIMILQYISPQFRELIYWFTNPYEIVNVDLSIYIGTRILGLTYGLATTSMINLVAVLIYIYLRSNNFRITHLHNICILLVVSSMFLCGRSGLALMLILVPIYFILQRKGFIKNIFYFLILLIITYYFFTFYLPLYCKNFNCSMAVFSQLYWLQELFSFAISGESKTISHVFKEISMPSELITYLIGGTSTGIDSGYIKNIYQSGIFFSIISIFIYCIPLFYFRKIKKNPIILLSIIVMFSILIFQVKEMGFFVRGLWTIHLSFILLSILNLKTNFNKL
tara:strand:+ start:164 stop:1228 length:1065 start_codon:yes stop_codon:yes gene_type:complete